MTICAQDRKCIFGDIVNNKMGLNDIGNIIKNNWELLSKRFPIELDTFQIMPNHFHSIINMNMRAGTNAVTLRAGTRPAPTNCNTNQNLTPPVGATLVVARDWATHDVVVAHPSPTLGEIIGAFKSITTDEYINGVKNYHWPSFNKRLWQRNYYEHIIRNACPAEPHHEPCSNRTRRRMARFCGENELYKIQEYIKLNPMGWEQDRNNPDHI